MNPTIAAALIGVGGSVLVAITGLLTTRAITARQFSEAHQGRIWDKQAATYIDAINGVRWRTAQRDRELTVIKFTGRQPASPDPADRPVDWTELQGRLFAFASPEVLIALRTAGDAGRVADDRITKLFGLITFAVPLGEQWNFISHSTDEIEQAIESADHAAQAASDLDDALIDAIRADLHGRNGRALKRLTPEAKRSIDA